jgi:phage/plasmid-like protein (TIGR03299 family)
MAHMVETMAYAGETPWHSLGVEVPSDLTPEQMMEKAGLNWTVEQRDLYCHKSSKSSGMIKVPDKKALVRTSDDALLDVTGSDWNPLQNSTAFEFFNDFVRAGDMDMHTAGSLENGRRVWVLAKVNDAFEVIKNDVIEQYLLFSNPHKYGHSIDVRATPIRVVCHNTLSMALSGTTEHMVKVHHRQEFDADVVKETLGVAKEKLDTYKEAAKFLAGKRFAKDNIFEYFDAVFPRTSNKNEKVGEENISRNAKQAMEIMETQPGAEFARGTFWQLFNTVTYMTDHTLGRSADTRLTSAWYGSNHKKKLKALETAIQMAEAA